MRQGSWVNDNEILESFIAACKYLGNSELSVKNYINLLNKGILTVSHSTIIRRYGSWTKGIQILKKLAEKNNYDIESQNEPLHNGNIVFKDKKKSSIDWRKSLDVAMKVQDVYHKASISQEFANIEIKTNHPIAVMFSSDWHLMSGATDHISFKNHMNYLLKTPNLYMGVVGDMRDNFLTNFKNAAPVLSQVLNPEHQILVLNEIIKELEEKRKILFTCWDNHSDIRDEKVLGYSVEKAFIKGKKSVFLEGEGLVKLKVGKADYLIRAIHQTRYNSFINTLHGAKREFQLRFPANITVTGHTHNGSAFELYPHYRSLEKMGFPIGGDNWLVKTGSYKIGDKHSSRHFGDTQIGNPTAVLHNEFKDITMFSTPQKAIQFLNGNR